MDNSWFFNKQETLMILTSALLGLAAGAAVLIPALLKKRLEKQAKLKRVRVRPRRDQNPYQ